MALYGLNLTVNQGDFSASSVPTEREKPPRCASWPHSSLPRPAAPRCWATMWKSSPTPSGGSLVTCRFFGVYKDMEVTEYLDFFGACYRIHRQAGKNVSDVLDLVGLSEKRGALIGALSRACSSAWSGRVLIHDPKRSVIQQLFPDFYVLQTQQKFSPHFASLTVQKLQTTTPSYNIRVLLNNGVTVQATIAT